MVRLVALAGLTLVAASTMAQPLRPFVEERIALDPFGRINKVVPSRPGRCVALVSGNQRSTLAIYVYDAAGRCIGWDDENLPNMVDDRIVEWHPSVPSVYEVEFRNLGPSTNTADAAIK